MNSSSGISPTPCGEKWGQMKKDKISQKPGKKETSIVRSSAAEYLIFVEASGKGGVEAVYADETIWLTQIILRE